jgi:hypothetical protein
MQRSVSRMLEAGELASSAIKTFVANGGRYFAATAEERRARSITSHRASQLRASEERLQFRLRTAQGCSVPECPLRPPATNTPQHAIFLRWLEHDHVDPDTKVGNLANMRGDARDAELKKTVCLCAWHHFLRTRDQLHYRSSREAPTCRREIAAEKERRGCQHPLHQQMPYARILPSSWTEDSLAHAFLEVSHHVRGIAKRTNNGTERADAHHRDLETGDAVVFCRFCHLLYTALESRALYGSNAFNDHQFHCALIQFPAFVAHFEMTTAGFDWESERSRIMKKRKRAQPAEEEEDGRTEKEAKH